ncbi:peptidase domain-containing ABC transporter [Chryseobacterium sp. 22532]|uniref:peptidase domain-containing ABC transporter n=1 Tax=Chryseobacterium sp. 22532 TaxID=3453938 RepID=UPI003F872E20
MLKKNFPFIKQLDSQDCGFACLRMIGKYYNDNFYLENEIITNSNISRQGLSISDLKTISKEVGFNPIPVKLDFQKMIKNVQLPSIFFWNQNHYVVVYKITKSKIFVADPGFGKTVYKKEEFIKGWTQNGDDGIILVLEPTESLMSVKKNNGKAKTINLNYVTQYLKKHKIQFFLIALTLLLSSFIELIFPFFTQKVVDKGIIHKNINFIYLVLSAQIILFLSKISLEYYRSWLFMHISSRISFSIISDFLIKLTRLPFQYFNSKNIGDLTQRINDHKRVEGFLSQQLIQTVFAIFSVVVYSAILLYFSLNIFLTVLICSIVELLWIFSFLEKIRVNDHKDFSLLSKDQNKMYEMINSIQEIKLNNLEESKTRQWQSIQKNIYYNRLEKLKIDQKYQSYRFVSFFQTILVIFFASMAVIDSKMTIGGMLSVMFILGGISAPINQLISFVMQYQLVKISFERLNEIHNKKDEDNISTVNSLHETENIKFNNVSFSYDHKNFVLKNIDLLIPKNKTTAIVGVSGSGKTSLLKLILKFYTPQMGTIEVGDHQIDTINNQLWRNKCGVILQDSVIFSDTIKYNVSLEDNPNIEMLDKALELANIKTFVNSLLLKENTIIGAEGIGISQGQRQRLLIARTIYKNPDYIFFDEATNSLDAENERIIVDNINSFFRNRTMIVVAHRLSTVINADQIIVLDNGTIIEAGSHDELINLKGKYFSLIKNQLELGE